MTTKRYEIYKQFKKYVQQKDERPMDEICIGPNGFELQAQQNFLREYMKTYPNWDKLMLYHRLGSGKTCTAITMAEEYIKLYPTNKIKVILPARLRTNFIDELISPCGMEAYISSEDYSKFISSSTKSAVKQKIKETFLKAISSKYTIYSFEKLKIEALKSKNLIDWVKHFTQDSMIVIDEVHNMMSDKYEGNKAEQILKNGEPKKGVKGMNTILFKLLNSHAHETSKMIFLTATPIFDNISQMKEIALAMTPDAKISSKAKISEIIGYLRGRVSFFPGTSVNAYPDVDYINHNIPLSKTQDILTAEIQADNNEEYMENINGKELSESFMAKQRQVSIACLPGEVQIKGKIDEVLENMKEYCPKIKAMIDEIEGNIGKHIVYSNFVQSGLRIVEKALRKKGWLSLAEVSKDKSLWQENKVYALWDGSVKDVDKQLIKNVVNSIDNIEGNKVRVILGSPSVKEGVSFKHIQHMHLLDPVWNQSAKTQIEGRAIRFCSHVDIPKNHSTLKRKVDVHIYKIVPRKNGQIEQTCDQIIYDDIIEKKKKMVELGEKALKKVAIDHYLFRNMYSKNQLPSPKSPLGSAASEVRIRVNDNVVVLKGKNSKIKNFCPKKRRPIDDKCSQENMHIKKNKQGDDCCYKIKSIKVKKAQATSCPKKRQPIDGKCPDGQVMKDNKKGEPCCYKNTK